MKKNNLKFYLPVIGMGFFAILAQTLLFRRFLTLFEGNELSIGLFFFAWLGWVCIGAFLGKIKLFVRLRRNFPIVLIGYIPCFIIQFFIFQYSDMLIGGKVYEVASVDHLLMFAILFNLPVSILSGFLFIAASEWLACNVPDASVKTVYFCEAFGSFAGASLVTIMLYFGCCEERIFIVAALLIFLSLSGIFFIGRCLAIKTVYSVLILFILFLLVSAMPERVKQTGYYRQWDNFLKGGRFLGGFSTHSAEYIYGRYRDELIVISGGSIYESYPNLDSARNIAAEFLVQKPNAQNILVVGPGSFSICEVLSKLSQVKNVSYFDTDPMYSEKLDRILGRDITDNNKIEIVHSDIREFLQQNKNVYDLIVLTLPSASNLALNRYFSKEFFHLCERVMKQGGVMGVRYPAGENYMGSELTYLGSSIYVTLKQVFDNIVLMPGSESIFFAAKEPGIVSDNSRMLAKRFAEYESNTSLCSADQIKTFYVKNRIDFQLQKYLAEINDTGNSELINSDAEPKFCFFSLLFSIKKIADSQISEKNIQLLLRAVFPALLLVLLTYVIFRWGYKRLYHQYGNKSTDRNLSEKDEHLCFKTDIYFSVFAAAIVGISLNLILMFKFQVLYGNLYLSFGLITALFMLGMGASAFLINSYLNNISAKMVLVVCTALFIFFIIFLMLTQIYYSLTVFSILFFCAGFFSGAYFPLACVFMNKYNISNYKVASSLDVVDNFGGAFGGLLISILVIPIVGIHNSLFLLAILIIAAVLGLWGITETSGTYMVGNNKFRSFKKMIRAAGFLVYGIVFIIIISPFLIQKSPGRQQKDSAKQTAVLSDEFSELTGVKGRAVLKEITLKGHSVSYYEYYNKDNILTGYIFNTKDFTDYAGGYGGTIHLMSYVSPNGEIQNFTVLDSNETPYYLNRALQNKNGYIGKNCLDSYGEHHLHSVTGATVSSNAISETLYRAGNLLLSKTVNQSKKDVYDITDNHGINWSIVLFLMFILTSIILNYTRDKKIGRGVVRTVYLLLTAIILGWLFNVQFSTDVVSKIITGKINFEYIGASTCLLLMPALVLLFGNIYCGYLCPFGALQELTGELGRFLFRGKGQPNLTIKSSFWMIARSFKYIILTVLIITLFKSSGKSTYEKHDILISFFNFSFDDIAFKIGLCLIVLSIFYKRFWCRVLCPSGAFLAIMNGIHNMIFPHKIIIPRNCDIGVQDQFDIDCISCNRCFHNHSNERRKSSIVSVIFIIFAGLLFLAYFYVSLPYKETYADVGYSNIINEKQVKVKESSGKDKKVRKDSYLRKTPGRRRQKRLNSRSNFAGKNVNSSLYRQYINAGRLSDHEAMYYTKLQE